MKPNMRVVLLTAALLASLAIVPVQVEASEPSCKDAKTFDPATTSAASIQVQIHHRGLGARFVVCVLDEEGRRLGMMQGSGTGNAVIVGGFHLPLDRYRVVVEGESTNPLVMGRATVSQWVDSATCPTGTTTAIVESWTWPWGYGMAARGDACVPKRSSALGTPETSLIGPVPRQRG